MEDLEQYVHTFSSFYENHVRTSFINAVEQSNRKLIKFYLTDDSLSQRADVCEAGIPSLESVGNLSIFLEVKADHEK